MIKIVGLLGKYIDKEMNFEIKERLKTVIVFEKHEQAEEFLKIITGMERPKSGDVYLFGNNIKQLSRDEMINLRKKIGIAFKDGGLISNLKAWENLLLPAVYHKVANQEDIKQKAKSLLEEFEFQKNPMITVAMLSILEKKVFGIIRAYLVNPMVLFFEYPFDGIDFMQKHWLAGKINKLCEKHTCVFILSSNAQTDLLGLTDGH